MAITLSDVNKSLRQQTVILEQTNTNIENTNTSIKSLADKLAESFAKDKADRLQQIEDRSEALAKKVPKTTDVKLPSGFTAGALQGIGITPLQNFLGDFFGSFFGEVLGRGNLFGKLAGAISLGAGKLIKWGAIGSLIAAFFGDEIINWLDPDGDGVANLPGGIELDLRDPLILAGLTLAAGAITRALVGFVVGSFTALGATGLAALFGAAGFKKLEDIMKKAAEKTTPKVVKRITRTRTNLRSDEIAPGEKIKPDIIEERTPRPVTTEPTPAITERRARLNEAQQVVRNNLLNLPEEYTYNNGILRERSTGRIVSATEVTPKILERTASTTDLTGTGMRGLGYALSPAEQLTQDIAERAAQSKVAPVSAAGKAVSGALRVLGSTAGLAVQLALLPSDLADGTAQAFIIEPYNDMVQAMQEGRPLAEILRHHNTLKERARIYPEVITEYGLDNILSLTPEEIDSATSMLFAQRAGQIYTSRRAQGLAPATAPIGRVSSARLAGQYGSIQVGQELSAMDVMQLENARIQVVPVPVPSAPAPAQNNGGGGMYVLPPAPTTDLLDGINTQMIAP
jgi:hypothetical protein